MYQRFNDNERTHRSAAQCFFWCSVSRELPRGLRLPRCRRSGTDRTTTSHPRAARSSLNGPTLPTRPDGKRCMPPVLRNRSTPTPADSGRADQPHSPAITRMLGKIVLTGVVHAPIPFERSEVVPFRWCLSGCYRPCGSHGSCDTIQFPRRCANGNRILLVISFAMDLAGGYLCTCSMDEAYMCHQTNNIRFSDATSLRKDVHTRDDLNKILHVLFGASAGRGDVQAKAE